MTKRKKRTKRYMSDAAFAEFKESLNEALAHAKGERADLRVTLQNLAIPTTQDGRGL